MSVSKKPVWSPSWRKARLRHEQTEARSCTETLPILRRGDQVRAGCPAVPLLSGCFLSLIFAIRALLSRAMTFADVLKAEMAARGMQTKELAAAIGVSCVTVQMWRTGRWNLKVRHALKLARLFNRSVESLFPDI